jgi:hypothetical protein
VSTVSLGAASSATTNSVTFAGYVGAIAATGSAGADTFVDGGTGVDGAAANAVNSSDTFAGSTGTDVISYAGHVATDTNTLAANEANTNGLAMNFGNVTTTFYTGTNTTSGGAVAGRTTLASGKVAQYDSGATGADASEKAILASGEVDTVSGFESVIGTGLNDYIISSAAGMTITGGAGNDIIIGGAGADTYIALTDVGSSNGIDVVTINTVDGTAISGNIFDFTASAAFIGTTAEDIIVVNDADVESGTNAFGATGDNIIILTGDFAANASALSALTFDGFSGFDTGQVLVIYSSSASADARIAVADVAVGGDISGAVDMVTLVGLNVVEASTGFGNTDFVLD